MRKKCTVVMLPAEKATDNQLFKWIEPGQDRLGIYNEMGAAQFNNSLAKDRITSAQHIYFVSDKEGEVGDWEYGFKKVIATTDRTIAEDTLELTIKYVEGDFPHTLSEAPPQIPTSFIQEYVKAKGKISVVELEYETVGKYGNMIFAKSPHNNESNSDMSIYEDRLKLTDNNEVVIHLDDGAGKMYSRDEVVELCRSAFDENRTTNQEADPFTYDKKWNNWVEKNLPTP